MGRPIHLRVLPDVNFNAETLRRIASVTGTDLADFEHPVQERQFSPDFKHSYLARMNALGEGFLFLLSAIPADYPHLTPAVRNRAETVFKLYTETFQKRFKEQAKEDDVREFKNALNQYGRLLVTTLKSLLGVSERTATKLLSKAEEYTALQHTRPDLMSLSNLTINSLYNDGKKRFRILQRENPYNGLSDKTKKELIRIKHLKSLSQMPLWYKALNRTNRQALLHLLNTKIPENTKASEWLQIKNLKAFDQMPSWYKRLHVSDRQQLLTLLNNKVPSTASLEDILNIRKADVGWFKTRKYPEWFTQMNVVDRGFLQRMLQQAPFESGLFQELRLIKQLVTPKWYNDMLDEEKELIQALVHEHPSDNTFLRALDDIRLLAMPKWYELMSPFEKPLLREILKTKVTDEDSLDAAFGNQLSRFRTVPFAPNYRRHECTVIDENNRVVFRTGRYGSSMVSSRSLQEQESHMSKEEKHDNKAVRVEHTFENLKQILLTAIEDVIEQQKDNEAKRQGGDNITLSVPYLVQTLISPHTMGLTPDGSLADDKQAGIEVLSQFIREELSQRIWVKTVKGPGDELKTVNIKVDVKPISINHPLNYARKITYTASDDADCGAFIDYVKGQMKKRPHLGRDPELQHLLAEYESVLRLGGMIQANFSDSHGRELFLSSLEQLIVDHMGGIASGSCVSGKDRKGIELMHTDAMALYHFFYGEWPSFKDESDGEKRKRFVDICANLFVSGHHQESASLNAAGANGIKTPWMYLPNDIAKAVSAKYLEDNSQRDDPLHVQDVIADINELKAITGLKSVTGGVDNRASFDRLVDTQLMRLIQSAKLSAAAHKDNEGLKKSLDLIIKLLHQEAFWCGKTVSAKKLLEPFHYFFSVGGPILPKGVSECREFLAKVGHESAYLLPLFCYAVMGSSIDKKTRADETQLLYRAIQELYYAQGSEAETDFAYALLEKLAVHPDLKEARLLDLDKPPAIENPIFDPSASAPHLSLDV